MAQTGVFVTSSCYHCKVSFSHPRSSACSERSFLKAGLICARKRMVLKPEHVDALSLLVWHAMREKELLKQGE